MAITDGDPPANDVAKLKAAAAQTIQSREDAATRIYELEQKLDRWVNYQTGLGTLVDKTRAAYFETPYRLNDVEITDLVSGNDLAAKCVEKRPNEMFRRGYTLEGKKAGELDKSKIQDLTEYATERLQADIRLHQGLTFGRQYGGALLILGIDDGRDQDEPVDEDNIKSIDFINQIDRRFSYVQDYYSDPMAPKYGQPRTYLVANAVATSAYRSATGAFGYKKSSEKKIKSSSAKYLNATASVMNVHESRLIRFDGVEPDVLTRQVLAGWSWSVLQRGYETLRLCDGSFDALAYLISDASQGVLKLKGLFNAITAGQEGKLKRRLETMDQMRSVMHSIALDSGAGEEFTRVQTSFAGIPDAIDRIMQRLAAAFDMPMTELFGMSPAGMNATGESDRIKWYDTIANEQTNFLAPKIRRLYRLIARAKDSPFKGQEVDFQVHFKPLYAPTDDELAKTRLTNAQRDVAYITAEVVTAEEVKLTVSDIYPSIDVEEIEEEIEAKTKFDPYQNDPIASAPVKAVGPPGLLGGGGPAGAAGGGGGGVSVGGVGGGAGGGTSEEQSPTMPLPGSPGTPVGEGQGSKPDPGTGDLPGATAQPQKVKPGKPPPLDDAAKAKLAAAVHLKGGDAHMALGNIGRAHAAYAKAAAILGTSSPHRKSRAISPPLSTLADALEADRGDAHDPDQPRERGLWTSLGSKEANEASDTAHAMGTIAAHRRAAQLHMNASTAHIQEASSRLAAGAAHGLSDEDRKRHGDAAARHFRVANNHLARAQAHISHQPAAEPARVGVADADAPLASKLPDASIVVVRRQGRILCVTRPEWPHEFAFPGGRVDPGESPKTAAIRELREECGVDVDVKPLMKVVSPLDGRRVHVFEATKCEGEAFAAEPGSTVMWLSPAEMLSGAHTFRDTVQKVLPTPRTDFDPDQPRDEDGKFGSGGGESASTASVTKRPDISSMKFIGAGASRNVYDDGDTVIKVAKNAKSKQDNRSEAESSGKSDLLAKITEHAPDYSWIRQEKASPITSAQIADHFGVSKSDATKSYSVKIKDAFGNDAVIHNKDWLYAATHTSISGEKYVRSAGKFVAAMNELKGKIPDIGLDDFAYIENWGAAKSGRPIITDYGFSKKEYARDHADFDPDQPRDEQGRFGEGGGGIARTLTERAFKKGGFSYRPKTPAPKSGYMVSLPTSAGVNHVISIADISDKHTSARELKSEVAGRVREWLSKARTAAAPDEHYLGGWLQKDEHNVPIALHLDVSQRFDDREKAVATGKERNRLAVWHLNENAEIPTGGTGK